MQTGIASAEVFIATSLDGFIARKDGDIGWLVEHPVPEGEDFGYADFMDGIGAIVMGRQTFEKVLTFPEWAYKVPVVVMSRTPQSVRVPEWLQGHVTLSADAPVAVLAGLAKQGVGRVCVDGGQIIRAFLEQGLIRRMTITLVPVLIGSGRPMWGHDGADIALTLDSVRQWPNGFAQMEYRIE